MELKRVTLVCGHYGSGKTGIALALAKELRKTREKVALADLDIVNPYFRAKDSRAYLDSIGVRLIASEYASSALDLPALPQEMYAITQDRSLSAVVDIGGDDRGALALGRWRDALLEENDYEMLFTVNMYRPLTRDAASAVRVMREIEQACGIACTHIVNNSNLGSETRLEDIAASRAYAREIAALTGLPIGMTCVSSALAAQGNGVFSDMFILDPATPRVLYEI